MAQILLKLMLPRNDCDRLFPTRLVLVFLTLAGDTSWIVSGMEKITFPPKNECSYLK